MIRPSGRRGVVRQKIIHRVAQRLEAGLDDVAGHTHGAPDVLTVGALDGHAHGGSRAAAVEHAHLEVLQAHGVQAGVEVAEGFAQGQVKGVDRAVALGGVVERIREMPDQSEESLYRMAMELAVEANARRTAAARILSCLKQEEPKETKKEKSKKEAAE